MMLLIKVQLLNFILDYSSLLSPFYLLTHFHTPILSLYFATYKTSNIKLVYENAAAGIEGLPVREEVLYTSSIIT